MPCWYTCPSCGGSGKYLEMVIQGTKMETRTITCSKCNGRGEIRR